MNPPLKNHQNVYNKKLSFNLYYTPYIFTRLCRVTPLPSFFLSPSKFDNDTQSTNHNSPAHITHTHTIMKTLHGKVAVGFNCSKLSRQIRGISYAKQCGDIFQPRQCISGLMRFFVRRVAGDVRRFTSVITFKRVQSVFVVWICMLRFLFCV